MDNRRDKNGEYLPDEVRLNKYGRFLRKTSLDEIPEAFNIIKGDMSLIGPRPLLVQYLPLYSEKQKHRHDVRPGLSGYAQVNGRNSISWTHKFELDCEYVEKITFLSFIIFRLQDFVSLLCMDRPSVRIWHILDLPINFVIMRPFRFSIMETVSVILLMWMILLRE